MTYGNTMAATTTTTQTASPTSTPWTYTLGSTTATGGAGAASGSRVTSDKSGKTFGIGVRGFIGAEYFIFPKISVGGEFGWGIGYSMTGASTQKTETTGGTGPAVGTTESKGNKTSSLTLDTDKNWFGTGNATLRLNLHF